jgi:hypothetical protein
MAARDELVAEVVLRLGQRRQRFFEQRGLLLVDEVRDFLLVLVRLGDGLDLKDEALRIRPDDAEAPMRGLVVIFERGQ